MNIAAIPTEYHGVRFRSRLEAKWAVLFDLLGWRWEYEPLDLEGYVPDFMLTLATRVAVEVKPIAWDETTGDAEFLEPAKAKLLSWDGDALILGASVRSDRLGLLREDGEWSDAFTFLCDGCGRKSFAHSALSWWCRVTGCYEGNAHILHGTWDTLADFRAASNRVQWRPVK